MSEYTPQPGKKAPVPSNPWIDGNDLREVMSINGITTYQWRDSRMVVDIRDEDNEVIDMYEVKNSV